MCSASYLWRTDRWVRHLLVCSVSSIPTPSTNVHDRQARVALVHVDPARVYLNEARLCFSLVTETEKHTDRLLNFHISTVHPSAFWSVQTRTV